MENKPRGYWTKENCLIESLKYTTIGDFRKNSVRAYRVMLKNNWLNEINLDRKINNKGFWNKEKCKEVALKYNTKSEFKSNYGVAYTKALKNGWLKDICSHMILSGHKYKRCIYAVEFLDNHVYIGLSYNMNKRFDDHTKDANYNGSSVLEHIKNTNSIPILKQLTDYIDVELASKMEEIKRNDYKNSGWIILNKVKCGGIGGNILKLTKEKCLEEALKYDNKGDFIKFSQSAYNKACKFKWLEEITKHMKIKDNRIKYENK